MATITNTQILSVSRGNNQNFVEFIYTLSTGDIVRDGPRFMNVGDDLNAKASDIGARMLEDKAQQELDQWLLS